MPTLNWIGKEAVVKHHKDVPYRLLEPVPELSCGDPGSGNLIVQGDNLHALKALLPRYAGQVKCIYIDPPYNTGNENWVYNDNVNSPEIRKWLGQVVGREGETLDRHDRWLCMMYPRLTLLKQFLKDDGAIFISIDDYSLHYLRMLMDEIFGVNCFKNTIAVRRGIKSVQAQFEDVSALAVGHEYIVVYALKSKCRFPKLMFEHADMQPGKWDTFWRGTDRPTMRYELFGYTPDKGQWRWEKNRAKEAIKNYENYLNDHAAQMSLDDWYLDNLTTTNKKLNFVRKNGEGSIQYYVPPRGGRLLSDNWMDILLTGSETDFDTEKNTPLIERLIGWLTVEEDIILDSFAGSGTTGHAVLNQNAEDGGKRRFILVEMDDNIARNITAERVRRISQGYANAKGEDVKGLGGGFQFCKLSEEPLFTSEGQIRADVTFAQLAEFVWFVETGTGFTGKADSPLIGIHEGRAVYLLYNGILKDKSVSGGNVLTGPVYELLPRFDGPKVIYAAACRLGVSRLAREGIVFKQTPYALEGGL
jgi:site-specific DNA-methyltransferase (adenine-specific)/adenine-specific DNA-methyltransferase